MLPYTGRRCTFAKFKICEVSCFHVFSLVHLELIMCEIPESFSRCLLEMPKLRSLCIWPDTFSEHVRRCEILKIEKFLEVNSQKRHRLDASCGFYRLDASLSSSGIKPMALSSLISNWKTRLHAI